MRKHKTTNSRSGAAVRRKAKGTTPASKRGPGRPPRQDEPQRIAVLIPGDLKRWLRVTAAEQDRDMGDIVAEALEAHRRRP